MVGILIDKNLIDVGYGMPITLSSLFGSGTPPPHLIPSSSPGAPFFRTDEEEAPSVTVDLLCIRHVHRIRVFNNETETNLNLPVAVSVSTDGAAWSEMLVSTMDFGGHITNTPLCVSFKYYTPCRYVRVQARAPTSLRLSYIEIAAPLPHEYLGKLDNIRVTPTGVLADYRHHDSYGFAWTFTCTLGMIFNARLLGVTIDQISYRLCLREFKDIPEEDSYYWLFEARPRSPADQPDQMPAFERHGVYVSFPLDALAVYADLYFRPHKRVSAFADGLVARYGLDLSKTIVLFYRGTDKSVEVTPATPEDYVAVARSLMAQEDGLTVLCQTDQAQARDAVLRDVPGAVCFSELPVTGGATAIHNLNVSAEFGLGKSEVALRLLAVTTLVARAKYVVTHTGNLGAWVAIYRGRSEGLYQFCEDGKLRGPTGAVLSLALDPIES